MHLNRLIIPLNIGVKSQDTEIKGKTPISFAIDFRIPLILLDTTTAIASFVSGSFSFSALEEIRGQSCLEGTAD